MIIQKNASYSNKFMITLNDVVRIVFIDERNQMHSSIEIVMTVENFKQLVECSEKLLFDIRKGNLNA